MIDGLAVLVCWVLVPVVMTASAIAADPIESLDVTYGEVDGVALKLDLYQPGENANGAAIVLIHGGGWAQGDKSNLRGEARRMAEQGYVAATIGYRLAPSAIFPAQVDDVRLAVRYLNSRGSEFGFTPAKLGAVGYSAGAHLSMMLGVIDEDDGFEPVGGLDDQSSEVAAVVSYFGPTDLTSGQIPNPSMGILSRFLGGTREEVPERYRAASPVSYVDPRDAPMLLFQGTRDPLVPRAQAMLMADRLTEESVQGRVELLIGASHGWGGETLDYTRAETMAFFERYLVNRE